MNNNEMIRKINKSEKDIVKVNEHLETIATINGQLVVLVGIVQTLHLEMLILIILENTFFT